MIEKNHLVVLDESIKTIEEQLRSWFGFGEEDQHVILAFKELKEVNEKWKTAMRSLNDKLTQVGKPHFGEDPVVYIEEGRIDILRRG